MYTEMEREHILWRLGRDDYKTWPGREIRDPDGAPRSGFAASQQRTDSLLASTSRMETGSVGHTVLAVPINHLFVKAPSFYLLSLQKENLCHLETLSSF